MSDLYPLLLLPEFKERVWGARDLAPLYPNYKVGGEPVGEVWLTGDECKVANGPLAGQTLGDLAKRYGRELVGGAAPEPDRFPLLLKFLFPRQKLSVQVHPTDEDARRAGLPCGKSECWYVVSAEIDAQVGLGLKPGTSRADFEAAVRRGDRADQLLNWLYVRSGEMLYNPAGTLHCIGPGSVLLETQQNSDTTYRLYDYGRSRELHLEQGLAAMKEKTSAAKISVVGSEPADILDRLMRKSFPLPSAFSVMVVEPHFAVFRVNLSGDHSWSLPPDRRSPHMLVALEGCGNLVACGAPRTALARGDAVVIPPRTPDCTVTPQWELKCLYISLAPDDVSEPNRVAP